MANSYDWNRTLKFSWAHIIAFVALIFMSYVMFMGDFYSNGGNFLTAVLKMVIADVVLLITFIGAQVEKGVDEKFASSIKIERTLVLLTLPAFLGAMIPYNHFWGVFAQREEVTKTFVQNIDSARALFDSYEGYARARDAQLEEQLTARKFKASAHVNYHKILRLQLSSAAVDKLITSSRTWLDASSESPTVWNAFLIGNAEKIQESLHGINQQLVEVSTPVLSVEDTSTPNFSEASPIDRIDAGFQSLKALYMKPTGVNLNTIWTALLLYFMLLFPYILQERNTRAEGYYKLWPWAQTSREQLQNFMLEPQEMESTYQADVLEGYNIHSQEELSEQEDRPQTSTASQQRGGFDDNNNVYSGTF